jgi:hypothetical protein
VEHDGLAEAVQLIGDAGDGLALVDVLVGEIEDAGDESGDGQGADSIRSAGAAWLA